MGNSSSSSQSNAPASESADATPKPPSYYSMVKNSYQALVNAIIRPPRSKYEASKLGPEQFLFCGKTITRKDFTLVNPREQRFCCSMWEPIERDRANPLLPCVVYMHGNSSSRLEALSALSLVLSLGATVLAFDFAGSGKSDGDYVTLGAFEKDDLQCAIEFLRAGGTTSTIALWGRSMGAATALLHGERDPSIAAMVLDSAFSSLVTLAEEMVEMGRKQGLFAPGFLVRIALQFVRSSVQKTAGFDIKSLTPIESADKCFIPALFIAAEDDHFVNKSHSEAIYSKYGGDKNLIVVEGDHNTARPRFLYDSVGIFLAQTLQIPPEWALPDGDMYIRRLPWSYSPNAAHIFSPSVTAVGSKHRFTAPAKVVTGPAHEARGAASPLPHPGEKQGCDYAHSASAASSGSGDGGGSSGGSGGRGEGEMSFDEMLALSIMLNEGDEEADFEALSLRYGPELAAQLVLNTEMYGGPDNDYGCGVGGSGGGGSGGNGNFTSDYNGFGGDRNGLDAPAVLGDAEAEEAMQQGVQQSLFGLMGGVGGVSAAAPSQSAAVSAADKYRQNASSVSANNPNAKVSGNHNSGSSWSLSSDGSSAGEGEQCSVFRDVVPEMSEPDKITASATASVSASTSANAAAVVFWRCSMCTMNNDHSLDTCEACGIMRA